MLSSTNVIDFISTHSPKINQKNLEYGLLIFLLVFVYFYINISLINLWCVYIITKTFTKYDRFDKPVQSVLEEISKFLNMIFEEYMKYTEKYTVPGSSKNNPIDLTNDNDNENETLDSNSESSKKDK